MDYSKMTNVLGLNYEEEIKKAILFVNKTLQGLTKERMCKVYSSYIYEYLHRKHIPVRIINTLELGISYEHVFLLVPTHNKKYYLIDPTFSQFTNNDLNELNINGYALINNESLVIYLNIINPRDDFYNFNVQDIFFSR